MPVKSRHRGHIRKSVQRQVARRVFVNVPQDTENAIFVVGRHLCFPGSFHVLDVTYPVRKSC